MRLSMVPDPHRDVEDQASSNPLDATRRGLAQGCHAEDHVEGLAVDDHAPVVSDIDA
jgi:hypothetical protein